MVTNNIMMKLKDKKDAEKVKAMLEGMKNQIDALLEAKVYLNDNPREANYDLLYVSRFENKDNQQVYVKHPVHVAVSKELGEFVEGMVMVGYEE